MSEENIDSLENSSVTTLDDEVLENTPIDENAGSAAVPEGGADPQAADQDLPSTETSLLANEAPKKSEKAEPPQLVFGATRTEYNEKPFPITMYHWKVNESFPNVAAPNFDVIVSQYVLLQVNRHVSETLERELGGFLLGNRYHCPVSKRDYIQIDNFSEARFSSSDEVSLTLSPETWFQLHNDLDGQNRGKQLLGWYHSHPKMSVFLSPMDVRLHTENFESNKFSVALVIEPEKKTGGFFCWRWDSENDKFAENKTLHQNARMSFYEFKGAVENETYMPWSEYSCTDCETGLPVTPQLTAEYSKDPAPSPNVVTKAPIRPKSEPLTEEKPAWLYPSAAALLVIITLAVGVLAWRYLGTPPTGEVAATNSQSNQASTASNTSPAVNDKKAADSKESVSIAGKSVSASNKDNQYLILKFNGQIDADDYRFLVNGIEQTLIKDPKKEEKKFEPKFNDSIKQAREGNVSFGVYRLKLKNPIVDDEIFVEAEMIRTKDSAVVFTDKNFALEKTTIVQTPAPAPIVIEQAAKPFNPAAKPKPEPRRAGPVTKKPKPEPRGGTPR